MKQWTVREHQVMKQFTCYVPLVSLSFYLFCAVVAYMSISISMSASMSVFVTKRPR